MYLFLCHLSDIETLGVSYVTGKFTAMNVVHSNNK